MMSKQNPEFVLKYSDPLFQGERYDLYGKELMYGIL